MNARLQDASTDLASLLSRLSALRDADEAKVVAGELLQILKAELDAPSPYAAHTFRSASEDLSKLPPECGSEALVECLLTVARYCYLSNRAGEGVAPAAQATACARKLSDKRLLRKGLTLTGLMLAESGDVPSAVNAYAEALSVARGLGDSRSEAPVWNNLGVMLMEAAQFSDAAKCFERAVLFGSGEQAVTQRVALINAALCARNVRDFKTGLSQARRAMDMNPNPTTAEECLHRTVGEANYARLLLAAGDLASAERHVEAAVCCSKEAPIAKSEYTVLQVRGLFEVYSGRCDSGLALLEQTLGYARQHLPAEVHDALSTYIEGCEAAGQPDVALVYLHELLALNREAAAARALVRRYHEDHQAGTGFADEDFKGRLAGDAARLQTALDSQLQRMINAAIDAGLAAAHDLYRVFRVARLAELFATREGWDPEQVQPVVLAAKLIDIGMIATPEPLLTKTRGLSEGERKLVDDHTRFGAELLAQASLATLQPCIPVVRFHHECWDGSGPWSLKGEAIPLEARLVALCDAFDAMTHPRPWRTEPLTPAMALREIAEQADRQFDPELAARFVDLVQHEFWKHDDFFVFLGEEGRGNEYVKARERIATMLQTEAQP